MCLPNLKSTRVVVARALVWGLVAGWLVGASCAQQAIVGPFSLQDISASAGIDFVHADGSSGEEYLVELMGAGLATLDYDNNGLLDVYLLNGRALPTPAERGESDALFRNVGGMRFKAAPQAVGHQPGYGMGIAVADYNEDGFEDLYIANYGRNTLLENNGDGTFVDVTDAAKVGDELKYSSGVVFLDANGDGYLDLLCGNYVEFTFERHAKLAPVAFPFPPGPKDYAGEPDTLYISQADGTFANATQASGLALFRGPTMALLAGDFDQDGDTDVFVCSDGQPNYLYLNEGAGKFSEAGLLTGVAFDARGNANGSMGVDAADLNGDSFDDLFVTDYARQTPMLFLSYAGAGFVDSAAALRAGRSVVPHVNWGAGLVDFDCDGDKDLFICNGHFLKRAAELDPKTDFGVANHVLENLGNGGFRYRANTIIDEKISSSRGGVFDDLDNDGDIDVVVLNCNAKASVLRNSGKPRNAWLQLRLVGKSVNRSAIGSRVTVEANGTEQSAEVRSGRGYQSHFGSRLHFGLGDENNVAEKVRILWPDGQVQQLSNLPARQVLTIVQP